MGMGVSGGEEGARNGPSLMPGGPREAYDRVRPILEAISAKTDSGACVTYIGELGSGNYVKMVHNGIEYGDMQLIAEAYDILKTVGGLSNEELHETFSAWNAGELNSYLIEITAKIFARKEDDGCVGPPPPPPRTHTHTHTQTHARTRTRAMGSKQCPTRPRSLSHAHTNAPTLARSSGKYTVDFIVDRTGAKGTGAMTVKEGAERGIAAGTIAAALDARFLSSLKAERVAASAVLRGPEASATPLVVDKAALVADVRAALYVAKICSYAQGMNLIREAARVNGWSVDLGECARIWKGGCIIRAVFLDRIKSAYAKNGALANLLVDGDFAAEVNARQGAWRRVVSLCVASGIACPAFSASLGYFDQYRRARLPANLTQAQRDFFGAHTFERTDLPEGTWVHTQWEPKA